MEALPACTNAVGAKLSEASANSEASLNLSRSTYNPILKLLYDWAMKIANTV